MLELLPRCRLCVRLKAKCSNNVQVALTANAGPAFRNTLSAGDRNTLALAFFFASLDQDPQLAQKILVIDDPMTSLDEHRSLTTVQEMRRMLARVSQVIVLSHSKPFLCQLWEGADTAVRQALMIRRDGIGSTLALWDVNQVQRDKHGETKTASPNTTGDTLSCRDIFRLLTRGPSGVSPPRCDTSSKPSCAWLTRPHFRPACC